jgi:hypothetical protein
MNEYKTGDEKETIILPVEQLFFTCNKINILYTNFLILLPGIKSYICNWPQAKYENFRDVIGNFPYKYNPVSI